MWACVRTTASRRAGSTGGADQFRSRSAFTPWKRPQSTRIRAASVSTRYFEPVTVLAAPRKEMRVIGASGRLLRLLRLRLVELRELVVLGGDFRVLFGDLLAVPRHLLALRHL